MKKFFIVCWAILCCSIIYAQNVSTGITAGGTSITPLGTQDGFWKLVSPSPVIGQAYAVQNGASATQNFFPNVWEPTPVTGTNAQWIGPTTDLSSNPPGKYTFERDFTVYAGTGSFACNFSIANDDDLLSLSLVRPNGSTIALPVTTANHYLLSQPITKTVNCPDTGVWKIRAKIDYVDNIGGFLLSGYINQSPKAICDSTCKFILRGVTGGGSFNCGTAFNLLCGKSYDFGPQLSCSGGRCITTINNVNLTDASNNTPFWAAAFLANNGNGLLSIPANIAPGTYTLTYYYGINGDTCGSCTYYLNIDCVQSNYCVKNLLFDDFNNPSAWTQIGTLTSISGGNFNFNNTPGAGYNRQYQAVPGLTTQTFIARIKLFVNSGNAPGHHILTLYQNGAADPVSFDAGSGYAATNNDAVLVDLTAQSAPSSSTSNPNPADLSNLWQFNLRYKQNTTLVTCPAKINLPALQTPYYVQLERGGSTLKLSVFSNSNYTSHIPGSPICFTINTQLNPLGFVNLGVYTWASQYRILNAQLDSLSICEGTDLVVCNPPCDSTCRLTLTAGGVAGNDFKCGDTINVKCKNVYDFAPHLMCDGTGSSIIQVSLLDAYGNTPTWAAAFININGNGSLNIPPNIPPGIYTLTYYWGIGGNTCDSCKFYLNISCKYKPCNCSFKTAISVNGVTLNPKCGDTISVECKKKIKFKPNLECKDSTIKLISVSVLDASGNTPSWAASFIGAIGNGVLNIPNNINGIYSVKYYWGIPGQRPCDSCTYYLNISCCNCVFGLTFEGGGVFSTFNCNDTIKAKCGNAYLTPLLRCNDSTIHIISFSLTDANNNTPSWAVGYNGSGSILIPAGASGIYTLNYVWGNNGGPCGSCRIYLVITCCPKCVFTNSIKGVKKGPAKAINCADTILVKCDTTYYFSPKLSCTGDTSHISNVTVHDASGNTPSWAAPFISNLGSGALTIPANVSGFYTIKYYWSFGGVICDSCSYVLKIECCTNCTFSVTVSKKANVIIGSANCSDTLKVLCNSNNIYKPNLNCSGNTGIGITGVTLTDANNNTPSWASAFISNSGSGPLAIPSITSGIYTLTYYWGTGTLKCGSCKVYLRIQCCDSFKVDAGPDLINCCPSTGTQLTAVPTGGVAPYTYSWSPATGLNFTNIANPVTTASAATYVVTVTDAYGCVKTDTVKILKYTGPSCCRISGNKTKAQAYPNPFTNGFTLRLPAQSIANIKIIDVNGTPLEIKSKASGSVDMGKSLGYGAYTILVMYVDGTKEEIKLIKSPD